MKPTIIVAAKAALHTQSTTSSILLITDIFNCQRDKSEAGKYFKSVQEMNLQISK
jgi:hypothetical protein